MVTILAHGVAESSMSGYSARPGRPGHQAYGIGHMLYYRSTSSGKRAEADGGPHIGHPPETEPPYGRARARGTVIDAWSSTATIRETDATRPSPGSRRE
ncbi:hypothetical protein ACR6C2_34140 [Streptomyces sp. INA 01156]